MRGPFMAKAAAVAALMLASASPLAAQTYAITNAKMVAGDGSAPVDGATVVIRDGRIVAAGPGGLWPASPALWPWGCSAAPS